MHRYGRDSHRRYPHMAFDEMSYNSDVEIRAINALLQQAHKGKIIAGYVSGRLAGIAIICNKKVAWMDFDPNHARFINPRMVEGKTYAISDNDIRKLTWSSNYVSVYQKTIRR